MGQICLLKKENLESQNLRISVTPDQYMILDTIETKKNEISNG